MANTPANDIPLASMQGSKNGNLAQKENFIVAAASRKRFSFVISVRVIQSSESFSRWKVIGVGGQGLLKLVPCRDRVSKLQRGQS